ncbi:Nitrate reductase [NADH] [Gracilariopsis chorda]|uniref:Nitrate reductase n=1 Tax=Gracilariopsis chorda TaxID=448386 RepID=A0A2V3J6L8_9FLOR|nr:Nitrate reductase [NADH] [Gracilariopsis chorda]|eukprot:PXF50055.1 Nitrate reductase [NADH] [Gracilariopsis chorda]
MTFSTLASWDPNKKPAQSSLKNTPEATPESSLRGGQAYKSKNILWTNHVEQSLKMAHSQVDALPKDHQCTEIDPRDKNSPDEWIPRHPDLVRLTGKHPFNCEPPISQLLDQGFFTPISLHYVRNHGKAPNLDWNTHRITISGLVKNPITITMDELVALPSVTLPVTLVCAGNRRKEENMIKQTIGFSWGCAAHACNLWTGVRLSDLLELAQIDKSKAAHVCFAGVEKEGLPNGTYGTSIDIATALDPYGEVLIAYEQNHTRLHPDHGFPVRVVIPGWIGGRMVKWLDSIVVTDKPSENYYHFFDNRIMPPHVDAELAKSEGWWYKPEYLFNQLNINSAIVYPANGERLQLTGAGVYTIRGYAYSGGGRKVTRVEVSIDGGITWELCKLDYPEERFSHAPKFGKYYCWMFWEYTIDNFKLFSIAAGSGEIRCRAWDEANNTQPKDITWNLMGMGNNCHFTVKVIPKQISGDFALEFLHPTVPGPASGGWMPPPSKPVANGVAKGPAPPKSGSAPSLSTMVKSYSMREVEKHNSEDSAWIVVDGKVYDATPYLDDHPGGKASILMNAGQDSTEEFMAIHSDAAKTLLENYYIGELNDEHDGGQTTSLHLSKSSVQLMKDDLPNQDLTALDMAANSESPVALNPKKWLEFELIEKIELTHDTRLFKFKLPTPEHRLGLPVGYHMFIKSIIDNNLVMRAYTPVSSDDDLGTFTLCIKVYFAGVHPKFPEGGKMSQYMERMDIGDMLKVKGPLGHFDYKGKGRFIVKGQMRTASKIGLICGGTGLTPAYQVMKAVYKDLDDDTEIFLLYGNRTEKDILMREDLERMAKERDNIHVWYTLDKPSDDWEYSGGFITEQMIRDHIPAPGNDSFVGMCGPPPMINFACIPNLEKIGFDENDYMQF